MKPDEVIRLRGEADEHICAAINIMYKLGRAGDGNYAENIHTLERALLVPNPAARPGKQGDLTW